MAIVQKQSPPADGATIVGNAIRNLWRRPGAIAEALGGASVNLSQPLPVYSLGLDDIHGPDCINKVKIAGWRYLMEDSNTVAYADLVDHPTGGQIFASLSRNLNAERLREAANLAEKVASGLPDCEARVLDVPALQVSAIWLFGASSRFIPYMDPEWFGGPSASVSVDPDLLDRLTRRADELRLHLQSGQAP